MHPTLTPAAAVALPAGGASSPPSGLPLWAAVPAAIIGGLALSLASPPAGWWPLALLSVTLALITLVGRSIGGALLVGAAFGGVFFFTHLIWVGEFLGPLPWIALAGLETILFSIGAVLITLAYRWTARLPHQGAAQLVAVPLLVAGLWASRELILASWPYSGFPWARIGMTLVESPLSEVASWTGVTGLSFLFVAMCAGVVQWARAGGPRFLRGGFPAMAVLVLLLLVPQFPTSPAGTLEVGWVQGNGPAAYFDTRERGDVLASQAEATAPLLGQPMDLLAWPEGGVDSDPLADPATAAALDGIVRQADAPLLMNAATARAGDVFNSSLLWTAESGERQRHDKINPVPFGEYVPDRWLYEMIVPDLVGLIQREYTPGTLPPLVTVDDVGVGLAICFDVIYDQVIWDGAREGAQLYVFQTNNADFRGTAENLQQLAFARMRAIETGRAVVNVSTTGTSQVIAPDGSTIASIPVDTAAAAITTVPLRTGLTPATILGPWISALVPLGAFGALTVLGILHRVRNRSSV
ncbi:apolipoprotein N-acyltransferase [Microbacterium sp. Y-01]|uniref:apolipoprotein N-acyltransferase n=1 Tax=Microbacterium sp. Y-01 TaxID=2048898 RepID=UPI000F5F95B4|nr:apolipoprotein N-acyltransferase [Microbacterium sp. Y-01]AZH79348.1 apolipoprotein N-acyltransferase [Microbacterium sp. Y-01]